MDGYIYSFFENAVRKSVVPQSTRQRQKVNLTMH